MIVLFLDSFSFTKKAYRRVIKKRRRAIRRVTWTGPRFLRSKKRVSNGSEASYRRYSNKKISTTFTLAGVLAASWQISYFLRRDCILRKRGGRFSASLFASRPSLYRPIYTSGCGSKQLSALLVFCWLLCIFADEYTILNETWFRNWKRLLFSYVVPIALQRLLRL